MVMLLKTEVCLVINRIKINHKKTVYPSRDSYSNKNGRSLSCFSTIIFMPLNNKNYKSLSYITNDIVLSTFCDFLFWVIKMQSSVMAIKIRMVDLKACMRKKQCITVRIATTKTNRSCHITSLSF